MGETMKTLAQIIEADNRAIVTVGPREFVDHALQLMAEHEVGAVLVMEKGRLVGIASERDYARRTAQGKLADDAQVQEIMTPQVVCASAQTTVEEAMAIMAEHHIRHLPVLDDYKDVVGVVSVRDLIQEAVAEQPLVFQELGNCAAT